MRYIGLALAVLMLSGCKTTMTVFPGEVNKDGQSTLCRIEMDGNGIGEVALKDGQVTGAKIDTKTNVNILSQVAPIVSDVSKASMTKEMLKD